MLIAKKNSPHFFFVGGVVGVLGSTFLACRSTLKLEETVDEIRKEVSDVKELKALSETPDSDEVALNYAEKEYARDLGVVYFKGAVKLGKLYGPAVVLGATSVAALTGSHIQLTRRNTALTATVAAVSKALDEYRDRVREAIGDEQELDIFRGVREEEVVDEKGKKKIIKVINPDALSLYSKCFDETNPRWEKYSDYNRSFLVSQERYLNHRLQAYGHVFLNEVYDALGFEHTTPGAVVGWVRDGNGDGYIDFGLHEARNADFMSGAEPSIWLDFNVDGVIYDLI